MNNNYFGGVSGLLEEVRVFQPEGPGVSIIQLVGILTFAEACRETFKREVGEAPTWLKPQMESVRAELKRRIADEKARALVHLRSQYEALATAEEKRQRIKEKIAELEKGE